MDAANRKSTGRKDEGLSSFESAKERLKREVGQRLRLERERMPTRILQKDVAAAVSDGYHESNISHAESGGLDMPYFVLAQVAKFYQVSTDYLLGLTKDRTPADLRKILTNAEPDPAADFIAIYPQPALAAAGISGGGTVTIPDPGTTKPFAFSRARLEEAGMKADTSTVFVVLGDSMHPTLPDGSAILVDLLRRDAIEDGLFVFHCCGYLQIKRARHIAGTGWWWVSDNPTYPAAQFESDEMEVWGQVRWGMYRFGDAGR